jgi:hypothetical protein
MKVGLVLNSNYELKKSKSKNTMCAQCPFGYPNCEYAHWVSMKMMKLFLYYGSCTKNNFFVSKL